MAHGNLGREKPWTNRATVSPSALDLAWAAGFLEGEATFALASRGSQAIAVEQIEPEPILRLLAYFGGSIHFIDRARNHKRYPTERPRLRWTVSGARARGVMMTLYGSLSPTRRQAIARALELIPVESR